MSDSSSAVLSSLAMGCRLNSKSPLLILALALCFPRLDVRSNLDQLG
jgi:hypothetical protein